MWVYGSAFAAAMLSPVILGATAVILRHHARLGGAQPAARAACVMVLAAVVAAALPPGELVHVFESLWPSVSPLRGVLLIAPLLLFWAWWFSGGVVLLVYAAVLAIGGMLGHTLGVMRLRLITGWDWLWQMLALLLPDDRLGWGFAGVLLAFLLLAAGGGASWARQRIARRRSEASGLLIPE
jgi:hypothetical protein